MPHSSNDDLLASRYSIVVAVAKRAKQLREGAPKLVESKSRNPITIALDEIAKGKIQIVIPTPEELETIKQQMAAQAYTKPGLRETAELLKLTESEETEQTIQAEEVEQTNKESSDESETKSGSDAAAIETEESALEEDIETDDAASAI